MLADLCTGRRNASEPALQNHHQGSTAVGEEDRQVDVLRLSHGKAADVSTACRFLSSIMLSEVECMMRAVTEFLICSACQTLSAAGSRHLLTYISGPFRPGDGHGFFHRPIPCTRYLELHVSVQGV